MATYPIRQLADNGGTAPFVPVTAPEAVQFPDGSNLNTFIGSVATIESNPVAANHAVGEFLCINGQVYGVIDAITAGDSISLGENVQVANLGAQITALNNGLSMKTASQATTVDTTIVFRKIGRLVIASHAGNFSVGATGTRYTISEIPAEFTPIGDEYFSCVLTNSQNVVGNARLFFERNTRRVHLVSSLTGIQEYRFTVAYFSAS